MPIFSSQLGKVESYNPEQGIKTMANHLRKIQEELEYRLMHLDSTNVSEIDASQTTIKTGSGDLLTRLEKDENNYTEIRESVSGLSVKVAGYEETVDGYTTQVAEYQAAVDSFSASIQKYSTDVDGYKDQTAQYAATLDGYAAKLSEYTTAVNGYTQKDAEYIAALEGYSTKVSQYETAVGGYSQKVSEFTQTVGGFNTTVSNYQKDVNGYSQQVSSLTQTAEGLQATVQNLETGMGHMLKMDANGVYIVDKNGNAVTISGGQIDASTLTVNAANITGTLKVGAIPSTIARTNQIPGALSDLDDDLGLVTEDNVTTITHNAISTASISANQITSGTLNANYVNVKGLLKILVGGLNYGWIGGTDMGSTAGAVLTGPSTMHGCMATNTGAKLVYDINEHMIWVAEDGCSSSSAMKVFSDRRLKEDICYELDDAEAMFNQLRPCSFRIIKDKHHKKSWGFIAQDAISAAEEAGMDAGNLAMFGNSDGMHTIAYGEMTALNTHMIQKLMARVEALEEAKA